MGRRPREKPESIAVFNGTDLWNKGNREVENNSQALRRNRVLLFSWRYLLDNKKKCHILRVGKNISNITTMARRGGSRL